MPHHASHLRRVWEAGGLPPISSPCLLLLPATAVSPPIPSPVHTSHIYIHSLFLSLRAHSPLSSHFHFPQNLASHFLRPPTGDIERLSSAFQPLLLTPASASPPPPPLGLHSQSQRASAFPIQCFHTFQVC